MHTGSIDGMVAIIGLIPAKNVGVFVLGNLDHAEVRHALMYQVFDMYGANAGNARRDWSGDLRALFASRRAAAVAQQPARATNTRPSLALERYAGVYADSAYGVIEVTHANGALSARWEKAQLGPLEHWQYETFRSRPPNGDPRTLTFVPDGAGGVSGVRSFGTTFVKARR
jgi:hypothetical protein